jgi:hypothetical protein
MKELETRTCADSKCGAKFRCLPTSTQTGCCRDHDTVGKTYRDKMVMRRLKHKKKPVDELTGAELIDVTDLVIDEE